MGGMAALVRSSAVLVVGALIFATACVEKGYIRLARPHVYDSETSRKALLESGARISAQVRAKGQVGTVQESFSARELSAARAAVTVQPGAAADATPPTPPASAISAASALPTLASVPAGTFNGTIPEQVNDLTHLESQALEVDLLYSGTGDHAFLGPYARVYLVRFDIGLFPTRQNYFLYPLLWIRSGFGNAYNFTKGWFAQVSFLLPGLGSEVYVYDVDPRYSVLTANEGLANLRSLQLTGAAAVPQGAAALDYLRQLEEQLAQQRRYPLQLGAMRDEREFSWTFGPRRRVERRSWLWAWLPFVGRYKIESRLEPGSRTAHAVLVVRDIRRLLPCREEKTVSAPTPPKAHEIESVQNELERFAAKPHVLGYQGALSDKADAMAKSIAEKDLRRLALFDEFLPECSRKIKARIELPIVAKATYLELDRPDSPHPVPIRQIATGRAEAAKAALYKMTLSLPVGPPPIPDPRPVTVGKPTPMGQRTLLPLEVQEANFDEEPPRNVELRTARLNGSSLAVREVRVIGETKLEVLVDGLQKPPQSAGDPPCADPGSKGGTKTPPKTAGDTTCVEVRPTVETSVRRFEGQSEKVDIAWGPPPASAKASLATTFGSTGTLITVAFADPKAFGPADVASVQLGTKTVSANSPAAPGGWWTTENSIQLLCPEPDAGAATVDALLVLTPAGALKNKKDSRLRIGSFTYIRSKE
jgi:hypothetical protein